MSGVVDDPGSVFDGCRYFGRADEAYQEMLERRTARGVKDAFLPGGRMPRRQEDDFYNSGAWQRLRYKTIMKHGACCQACGSRGCSRNPIQVDHIKPRSKNPELELDSNNLQVLCKDCNMGKGAWDVTDWRRG